MPNEALMAELNAWAAEFRVDPRGFDCGFYSHCNGDGVQLDRGNTVVMSYVGRQYGQPSASPIPRLMIVGMDHGRVEDERKRSQTYQARRESVEDFGRFSADKFNQHYAGVVRTAAAFLGGHGAHCATACKARCARSLGPVAVDVCVLDRLAQPNLVKCVSLNVPDMTCRATGTMRKSCCNHLFAEIGLLQPDIVVVHGVEERNQILAYLQSMNPMDLRCHTGVANVLYSVPALKCHFVFLLHPSRNWMERTWETRAVPALAYLKKTGIIPAE